MVLGAGRVKRGARAVTNMLPPSCEPATRRRRGGRLLLGQLAEKLGQLGEVPNDRRGAHSTERARHTLARRVLLGGAQSLVLCLGKPISELPSATPIEMTPAATPSLMSDTVSPTLATRSVGQVYA